MVNTVGHQPRFFGFQVYQMGLEFGPQPEFRGDETCVRVAIVNAIDRFKSPN